MRNTCLLSLFSCFITHLTLGTTDLVQPRLECYSEDLCALGPEYPHVHTVVGPGRVPFDCLLWSVHSLSLVSHWQTLTGSRGYCRAPALSATLLSSECPRWEDRECRLAWSTGTRWRRPGLHKWKGALVTVGKPGNSLLKCVLHLQGLQDVCKGTVCGDLKPFWDER